MGQAHGTKTHPPAVACKPGEFIGGGSGITAPLNIFKASDFKDNPVGIGKRVPVGALHRDPFGRAGNCLTALAAKDIFFLIGRWILRFFFKDVGMAVFTRAVRGDAKKMNAIGSGGDHFQNL